MTIYEEVHERMGDANTHRRFLARLAEILGAPCQPVLVTDAGFRVWWYELLEERGWYYVGRVRNRELMRWAQGGRWWHNKRLHAKASARAKALGELWLSKSRPLLTGFYLYKAKPKGRVKYTRAAKRARSAHSAKQAMREREPWLLASNLPARSTSAKRVVAIFRRRMQIEESFRDLKAPRHGFALRENLGRNRERVANLLLVAALAMLATWLMGLHGHRHGLHRGLQANTDKGRRVLSVFFVGRRLLAQRIKLTASDLGSALRTLRQHTAAQLPAGGAL